MSQAEAKFSCEGCGKTYKWKPEFAGRKVKCKCGFVMTAPVDPSPAPSDDELDMDALYSLADEGRAAATSTVAASIRCPSCRAEIEPGAAVCAQCGFNLKTGSKATAPKSGATPVAAVAGAPGVQSPGGAFAAFPAPRRGLQQEDVGDNQVLDLYLPLGLLAFGIFGVFAQYMWFGERLYSFAGAAPLVLIDIIVSFVVLAVGCLVAIKALDVAFGSPGTAALKVAAIALAPSAIAGFIGHIMGGAMGDWVGRIFALIAYFVLFFYLFDMDMNEVLFLTAILFFVRVFIAPFLLIAIAGALFATGGAGLSAAAQASRNDDKIIQDINDREPTDDALAWLNEVSGRMLGNTSHSATVKLLNDLMAVGCTKPTAVTIRGEGQTSAIWVKLPRDSEKRKKAIEIWNKFANDYKLDNKTDGGQTYLLMEGDQFRRFGMNRPRDGSDRPRLASGWIAPPYALSMGSGNCL